MIPTKKPDDFGKKDIVDKVIGKTTETTDTIDKFANAIEKGNKLIDNVMVLIERFKDLQQKKNPISPRDEILQRERNVMPQRDVTSDNPTSYHQTSYHPQPTQPKETIINNEAHGGNLIQKEAEFKVSEAIENLKELLGNLIKEYPDKTVKEFLEVDIKGLEDTEMLQPIIKTWVRKFISGVDIK